VKDSERESGAAWSKMGRGVTELGEEEDELKPFTERLDTDVYMRRLLASKQDGDDKPKKRRPAVAVIPGADYLATIPHAPWPSRSMLKRRIVLGSKEMVVKNGVTRIYYPSGAVYEGNVREGKRHGLGIYTWNSTGDSYAGMWWAGLPHGLGIGEYASGAAFCGEWYLGDRTGSGMYFFAPHLDEPHEEYAGQWRNDLPHGIGKRVSKDGTVYIGNWRKGMKHGDGIHRIAKDSFFNPMGAARNALRRARKEGATGRFKKLEAKDKHELDMNKVLGGIRDWHAEEAGIVLQEGRFAFDEFEPRDRNECREKKARLKSMKERSENPHDDDTPRAGAKKPGGDDDEEVVNPKDVAKRKQRQQRLKQIAKSQGRILSSKDFPLDEVELEDFEVFVQSGMETSDAAEMVAAKVDAKFHNVNFNFRVTKFEGTA